MGNEYCPEKLVVGVKYTSDILVVSWFSSKKKVVTKDTTSPPSALFKSGAGIKEKAILLGSFFFAVSFFTKILFRIFFISKLSLLKSIFCEKAEKEEAKTKNK